MSDAETRRDTFAVRMFNATVDTLDLFAIYLGDRLGYYTALAEEGPLSSAELAFRTRTDERYAREWLEQQAVSGILTVATASDDGRVREYAIPVGHDEVLVNETSRAYMTWSGSLLAGIGAVLPQVVDAYRTGSGIPFSAYGADFRDGTGMANRPAFQQRLAAEWIPTIPGLHERLARDGARIADVGCGVGWSCIAMAKAYPNAHVDGFDLDEASIVTAQRNATSEGVSDVVSFQIRDAGDPALAGQYDLVCAFTCIHDMSEPVAVLNSMRRLANDGGSVLVVDSMVDKPFAAPDDIDERLRYGLSVLHCLPVGRVEQPSAETGAVMRLETFRDYALRAGFTGVEVLPIEDNFWMFCRLIG